MFVNVGHDIPEGFGYDIRINGEDVTSGGSMLEKFSCIWVCVRINEQLFSLLGLVICICIVYSVLRLRSRLHVSELKSYTQSLLQ